MSFKPDGEFTFDDLVDTITVGEHSLTNAEREPLRMLAAPGFPIWKIQREMVSYAELLRSGLADCDLTDEEGVRRAIKIQAELRAIDWMTRMWERLLAKVEEGETE